MSVRFDASGDDLHRSVAGIVGCDIFWTVALWAKRKVDRGAFTNLFYVRAAGGDSTFEVFLNSDTSGDVLHAFEYPTGPSDLTGPTLTIDTWFFIVYRRMSQTIRILSYGTEAGGALTHVQNNDSRALTGTNINTLTLANDTSLEFFNGELAWVRMWDVCLSDAEIDAEWRYSTPWRIPNLAGDWRLASAATAGTDSGAFAQTLTVAGTLADGGANPTPPAMTAPALAYSYARKVPR